MNESTQTQLTASAITRELNREINRAKFRKDGQELEPKDYIDALDKAAPAAWRVTYTLYDHFNSKMLVYAILLIIFTVGLALAFIAWKVLIPEIHTHARLTIHAEDKDLTSEGTAKGTEDLSKKEALAQAVQDLTEEDNQPRTYIQETKPRFS